MLQVFITSTFYQYFITLLIFYIHYQFPRAVPYLLYRVLVYVFSFFPSDVTFPFFSFINVCLLDLLLGYTVVPFLSFDLKGFLCFLFSFLISFVFNVNLWHDFEIKRLQKKIGRL